MPKTKKRLLGFKAVRSWLIYHCPMRDSGSKVYPFQVALLAPKTVIGLFYYPMASSLCQTPMEAYTSLAHQIVRDEYLRRFLTDLYYQS